MKIDPKVSSESIIDAIVYETIKELDANREGGVEVVTVQAQLSIPDNVTNDAINRLKHKGELFEPESGKVQAI